MGEAKSIAVFYLLRRGNDPCLFGGFLASLRKHATAIDYMPFLIQKGFAEAEIEPLASSWVTERGQRATVLHVSDEGYDLTAYRTAAARIEASHCLFFNSYARLLAPRWLEVYADASARLGDDAVIGATGSWTSIDPELSFPSPHLRTNAIFLRRELYLSFDNPLDTKDACIRFESGPQSLSRSILRGGGRIAMVGRSGQVVPPESWPESRIYYSGDQEELLVADNRSHGYQVARARSRWRLSKAAWGDKRANIARRSWLSRKVLDWQWRHGRPVP
ncbi:hypothetical protein [Labrys monachus]|uniref:Uncharacterized protein n=1 Tax=Labrys monachus TaxID=217067 RepID=A0ABU0FDD0_9HYPH|nr:hypothetical protein [Labrys monachus]MDQ0392174.1 hypothetical protein [Labrys monachus]